MSRFSVTVLGCGSAKPSLRHHPSSTVVEHGGNLFMIDCGEGTQLQFQRCRLKMSRLQHIFLTHLHGDHVFGLPGLLDTLALTGKRGVMTVHTTPKGIDMISHIIDFFSPGRELDIKFEPIDPHKEEIVFENQTLTVRTIPLRHRIPTVGYVFEEKPKARHIVRDMIDFYNIPFYKLDDIRNGADYVTDDGTVVANDLLTTDADKRHSYVHIADTKYMPELAEKIKGADLLFHETTYLEKNIYDAKKRYHSTAMQAAMVARDAGAGRLLTGHYSSRYDDDNLFLEEARTIFPDTVLGREGLRLEI